MTRHLTRCDSLGELVALQKQFLRQTDLPSPPQVPTNGSGVSA